MGIICFTTYHFTSSYELWKKIWRWSNIRVPLTMRATKFWTPPEACANYNLKHSAGFVIKTMWTESHCVVTIKMCRVGVPHINVRIVTRNITIYRHFGCRPIICISVETALTFKCASSTIFNVIPWKIVWIWTETPDRHKIRRSWGIIKKAL